MNSGFPIHIQIIHLLKELRAENYLSHYQVYLEYPTVVRGAKIINAMKKFSKHRYPNKLYFYSHFQLLNYLDNLSA